MSGSFSAGGNQSSGGWPSGGWSQQPQGSPMCYRHPGRETHIRCQRCGRPICPDCMVGASVGFQCPECVNQGRSETRPQRTAFGAVTQMRAYVTYVLVGINLLVFGLAHLLPDADWTNRLFLLPRDPGFINAVGVNDGAYWQVLTSTFLHVDPLHLLMNMIGLWLFGSYLEMALGWARFVGLYLISGLAGSVTVYVVGASTSPVLGASGAVFGLFGAAFLLILQRKGDVSQLVMLLVLNIVIGFTAEGIAWEAHLGGLAAGALIAAAYAYSPRRRRTAIALGVQGLLLAVMVALFVMRHAQLA